MTAPLDAFPLTWPAGWKRTAPHARVRKYAFKVTEEAARYDLLDSLRKLGGRDVVISTDKPTRKDGLPMVSAREPNDPGVAVYWTWKGKPQVMACDAWATVRENMRSIGLAIEGLRAVERSGASQILERAFTGFAALPAPGSSGRPWRVVFAYQEHEPLTREKVNGTYRELAKLRHPDIAGGSHEAMTELNVALEAALREIERGRP